MRFAVGPRLVASAGDDEAGLVGEHDGLGAVAQAELVQHPAHVRLDRLLADDEPGRDLRIGQALGDEGAAPRSRVASVPTGVGDGRGPARP